MWCQQSRVKRFSLLPGAAQVEQQRGGQNNQQLTQMYHLPVRDNQLRASAQIIITVRLSQLFLQRYYRGE